MLSRQPIRSTRLNILVGENTRVDTAKHPLELSRVRAVSRHAREVHIQERVVRQIRSPGLDDGLGELGCELRVHGAAGRHRGHIPGVARVVLAGEGEGGDPALLAGEGGDADGAGEGHLEPQVAADVRAGDDELGGCAVPEGRRDRVDAVAC